MKLKYYNSKDKNKQIQHFTELKLKDDKKIQIFSDFDQDTTMAVLKCYIDCIIYPDEIEESKYAVELSES